MKDKVCRRLNKWLHMISINQTAEEHSAGGTSSTEKRCSIRKPSPTTMLLYTPACDVLSSLAPNSPQIQDVNGVEVLLKHPSLQSTPKDSDKLSSPVIISWYQRFNWQKKFSNTVQDGYETALFLLIDYFILLYLPVVLCGSRQMNRAGRYTCSNNSKYISVYVGW